MKHESCPCRYVILQENEKCVHCILGGELFCYSVARYNLHLNIIYYGSCHSLHRLKYYEGSSLGLHH